MSGDYDIDFDWDRIRVPKSRPPIRCRYCFNWFELQQMQPAEEIGAYWDTCKDCWQYDPRSKL